MILSSWVDSGLQPSLRRAFRGRWKVPGIDPEASDFRQGKITPTLLTGLDEIFSLWRYAPKKCQCQTYRLRFIFPLSVVALIILSDAVSSSSKVMSPTRTVLEL